jgi:hypothetical protein
MFDVQAILNMIKQGNPLAIAILIEIVMVAYGLLFKKGKKKRGKK